MTKKRVLSAALQIALVLILILPTWLHAQDADQLAAFKQALEADEFLVQEGRLTTADTYTAFCNGAVPSGFGFNMASPYSVSVLPKAPDQVVDNYLSFTFRLRPDEAIVYVFKTPPRVKYFSCQNYLMRQWSESQGAQRQVYASLGDAVNNESIFTAGNSNGGAGEVYDQLTIIIVTADQGIQARIKAAAEAAGYDPGIINILVIPTDTVALGVDQASDEFSFLFRTAFFDDPSQETPYFESLANAGVFRVTPTGQVTLNPYPVQAQRVRGTGTTEFSLMDDMVELRRAILAQFADDQAEELDARQWLVEGFEAIQRGIDVLGEIRDTTYIVTDQFTLSDDEFIMIYGVLHDQTGKATYTNLNLYDGTLLDNGFATDISVASANSVEDLAGTAQAYIPDNPEAHKLYVCKVARQCNGERPCLEVPSGLCDRIRLEVMYLVARAYLEPGRMVGPAYNEIVFDRAIKFSPGGSTTSRSGPIK